MDGALSKMLILGVFSLACLALRLRGLGPALRSPKGGHHWGYLMQIFINILECDIWNTP